MSKKRKQLSPVADDDVSSEVIPMAVVSVDRWVDEKEAASLLGVAVAFLQRRRVDGGGPKFAKLHEGRTGTVRYFVKDLHDWMKSKYRANTSEAEAS